LAMGHKAFRKVSLPLPKAGDPELDTAVAANVARLAPSDGQRDEAAR
jgi:hypothetical protein